MKINFYLLLVLLLTYSFGNAQSENIMNETSNIISVSELNDDTLAPVDELSVENKKEELLIDASYLKETTARTNSDIRIYLNRVNKKKVDNIKLLFPQINKLSRA